MNFLFRALCILFLCCATAQAQVAFNGTAIGDITLTGDATLASKYVARGIDASNGPVVQAGITATHEATGCYVRAWGSQLDFGDHDPTNGEIDLILGCAGNNEDGWTWDLNATHYIFTGAPTSLQYNFTEVVMALGYRFKYFTLGGEAAITLDYFGDGKKAMYTRATLGIPLTEKWSFSAHSGKQSINYSVDTKSYSEKAVGLTYQPSQRLRWYLGYKDANCKTCESGIIGKVQVTF